MARLSEPVGVPGRQLVGVKAIDGGDGEGVDLGGGQSANRRGGQVQALCGRKAQDAGRRELSDLVGGQAGHRGCVERGDLPGKERAELGVLQGCQTRARQSWQLRGAQRRELTGR